MDDDWPISISEAARRLEINFATASVLVRALEIPTVPMAWNNMAKGLHEPDYRRLEAVAGRFRRRRRLAGSGSASA